MENEETPKQTTEVPEPTYLEKSIQATEDYKKATEERLALLEREEKFHAQKMLGGTAEAGQPPVPEKKLTPAEYRDAVMAGKMNAQKTK